MVRIDAFQGPREPRQFEKAIPLGERKILLQQPVPLKRAKRHRQQRLAVAETDRPDRAGRNELVPARRALRRQHERPETRGQTELVQLVRHVVAAREIETHAVDRCLRECQPRRRLQPNADAPLDALRNRQRVERKVGRKGEIARGHDFERP